MGATANLPVAIAYAVTIVSDTMSRDTTCRRSFKQNPSQVMDRALDLDLLRRHLETSDANGQ